MLFLAVFCGFLTENLRENKVEREREQKYIISMIEDLTVDTANLSLVIPEFNANEIKLDTVLKMYYKLPVGYNDTLRRNLSVVRGFPDFIYTDRTMQQLKNSGGMRLIHKKAASDGIMEYDAKVRDLGLDVSTLSEIHHEARLLWNKIIDTEGIEQDKKMNSITQIEKGNRNYLLLYDKAILGEFYNTIRNYKRASFSVKTQEMQLKEKAIKLITLLKSEYYLD